MGKFFGFLWKTLTVAAFGVVAAFVVFALTAKDAGETVGICKEWGVPAQICEYAGLYAKFLSPVAEE